MLDSPSRESITVSPFISMLAEPVRPRSPVSSYSSTAESAVLRSVASVVSSTTASCPSSCTCVEVICNMIF